MDNEERIAVNPGVMMGKPVIRGTRITVELVLERLQMGETVEQIAGSLKNISKEDIFAAIDYAIDSVRREKLYVTPQGRANA